MLSVNVEAGAATVEKDVGGFCGGDGVEWGVLEEARRVIMDRQLESRKGD